MPEAVFVANLVMSLLALTIAATDAYPSRERLAFLAAAVPYGVLLEQLVILRFERYQYPVTEYLLTVADVPVVIGIGWAAIIYAGYRAAETWNLSTAATPAFVGLFALHVDLAIDAVAIRVGFWTWTPPGVWFGVPLGNFLGWFLVATLFAAAWLWLRDRIRSRVGLGLAAVALALVGLVAGLEAWDAVATTLPRRVAVLGGLLVVAAAVVAREGLDARAPDSRIAAVPFLYHGFYLGYLLALGMYRETPALLAVSGAMIAVSLLLHRDLLVGAVRARAA
jgi:uncharacterized membrane protein